MDFNYIQDELFRIARGFRDEGQEVMPVAFLLADDALITMPLRFPKPLWRTEILKAAKQTRATAIILQTEAWAVLGPQAASAISAKMAGIESLEDFEGRTEILTSRLECRDGTRRTLHADIHTDGTLGDTEVIVEGEVDGALVGFFRDDAG